VEPEPGPVPSALVVDFGGVLTADLSVAMGDWAESVGIGRAAFGALLKRWLWPDTAAEVVANPVHQLERGEIDVPEFERLLAAQLTTLDGSPVVAAGLLDGMFAGFAVDEDMLGLVREVRESGVRTALLSNSWGNEYPDMDGLFDVVVISGEVGMRKPEPRIYTLTLDLLGVPASACVFVDDFPLNVDAATALGMLGVRHRTYAQTSAELETLFGRSLTRRTAAGGPTP
jgi:putative hydrolase of the HAD superfamily